MSWRVGGEEVRQIMSLRGTPSMDSFIETASVIVDDLAAADTAGVVGTTRLKQIELYLAAFFAEVRHQQYASEGRAGANAGYQGQYGMHLDRNMYGQNALMLDSSGYLRRMSEGVVECSLDWGGLPPSEQTDYRDRD